jgi:non-ribosomal peptide synthetase component E (peptide arylation enzyme)
VLGERMCACVITRSGTSLTLDELTAFLLGKGIARFKLPERLEVFDEFPMTRVGKVSKRDLVELVTRVG